MERKEEEPATAADSCTSRPLALPNSGLFYEPHSCPFSNSTSSAGPINTTRAPAVGTAFVYKYNLAALSLSSNCTA